jgi:hypothetical protein
LTICTWHDPNITEINNSINLKSKSSHPSNIWNDNTYYEINSSHRTSSITHIIDIEQYDLQFDFVIESCNGSNKKSQTLEDDNFTKSPYSIMIEEFEYHNLSIKINEEQK